MKSLIAILMFVLGVQLSAQAQMHTDTLHVSGNCGTCKKKIESPFKNTTGVESASWDKKAKLFVVRYDPAVISLQKIKELIVAQGYDTEGLVAPDEAYNKLPKCCKYRSGSHED